VSEELNNIDNQIKELQKRALELKKSKTQTFDPDKAREGFFSVRNVVLWMKDLNSIFNVRKLIIYAVIVGCVAFYFYNKGKGDTPVHTNLDYKQELIIVLNGEELYKPAMSNDIFIRDTKTKQILKQLKAKDFPALREKLKAIGFQMQPIFIGGVGIGAKGAEGEVGVGVSFFRYWKMQLEAFLTQRGIYVGTSYAITENSGAGVAIGKGYDLSNRIIFYYRFNF
jgi:hypothetical protein